MIKRGHPLARRWDFIKSITSNPNDPNYQKYGGAKGLENHFRDWEHFATYVETHLGLPPYPNAKLNRINQDDHFRPGNLRWTDHKGMGNNQKRCIVLTYKRKKQTLSEWADMYKINYSTAYERYVRGWTIEQILNLKPNPGHQGRRS